MLRASLILTLFAASLAVAPVATPSQVVESIEVSIANLDVYVFDRKGEPVRGLTKDDFEVFENGVKQEITNFAEYSSEPARTAGAPGGTPNATATAAPRGRMLVVLIDIDDIDGTSRKKFFEGLRQYLRREQRATDLTTLLVWEKRLRVAVPPTSDLGPIDAILAKFQVTQDWSERVVLESMKEERMMAIDRDAAAIAAAGRGDMGFDPAAEKAFEERIVGEQRCSYLTRKIAALHELIGSFGGVERQKVMLLACDDLTTEPMPDCRLIDEVVALAAFANSYGFTIHAFHPPGVRDPSPYSRLDEQQRTYEETRGLDILARDTGGVFEMGAVRSVRKLESPAASLDHFYSIAYRLHGGKLDAPRTVSVRAKNKAWTVRSRRSVVAFSDEQRIRDAVVSSLYSADAPKSAFPLQASVRQTGANSRNLQFNVSVAIPLHALTLLPAADGNVAGRFSVYIAAGWEIGDSSGIVRKEQAFTRPAASVKEGEQIEYTFDLKVRTTTRRFVVAVRDEVSHEYGITTIDLRLAK